MGHDPFIIRFFTFLGFFTFFMVVLVTADNYLQLFVGWEGVGVCSYLLINFWYNRIAANKGAIKAMVMNRIADVFFIIGILFLLWKFKTTDYIIVFSLIDYIKDFNFFLIFSEINLLNFILSLLFIGAIGKSAQVGLHTWLADAMEGPTPVSSLLHAATMVPFYYNQNFKQSLYWSHFQYNKDFFLIIFYAICWNINNVKKWKGKKKI
jgi:NADH-quinone oxidoreductase subunit L